VIERGCEVYFWQDVSTIFIAKLPEVCLGHELKLAEPPLRTSSVKSDKTKLRRGEEWS
jgi:hypothetical protein